MLGLKLVLGVLYMILVIFVVVGFNVFLHALHGFKVCFRWE